MPQQMELNPPPPVTAPGRAFGDSTATARGTAAVAREAAALPLVGAQGAVSYSPSLARRASTGAEPPHKIPVTGAGALFVGVEGQHPGVQVPTEDGGSWRAGLAAWVMASLPSWLGSPC